MLTCEIIDTFGIISDLTNKIAKVSVISLIMYYPYFVFSVYHWIGYIVTYLIDKPYPNFFFPDLEAIHCIHYICVILHLKYIP